MSTKSILSLLAACAFTLSAQAFTIVIDAGHGAHDAGAVGSISKEKNINLRHALLLGDLIKERNPEIKVIYTRDKDVFVELNERARIANRNKADLFVSIHTNSSKNKSAQGIETFSLGASRSKENMEVAMLENSVILLEEDHESKYQGFDPNSTDSYIMFEFMKDQYSQRSIACADYIQSELVSSSNRNDRGVRQAGFLVLRATTMPSILIELGFISNKEEEKALNNEDNQIANAEAIYKGLVKYIHSLEKKGNETILKSSESAQSADKATATASENAKADATKNTTAESPKSTTVESPKSTTAESTKNATAESTKNATAEVKKVEPAKKEGVIYKLQILVSSKERKLQDPIFKGRKDVEVLKEKVGYKYFIGASNDYESVSALKKSLEDEFPGSFIVAYKNGVRINVNDALKNK